jgi:DNA-3-methyladenine glycosylase
MYGPPGHAYVYFVYGMHHCVNVVTQPRDVPEAVLVRALEPLDGVEVMRRRRGLPNAPSWRLCRGPGALCQALGIDRTRNADDLVTGPLRVLDAPDVPRGRIARSTRIGVAYAGADAERPWRFYVTDLPHVSGRRRTS